MKKAVAVSTTVVLGLFFGASSARADVIVGPGSATILSGGPGSGNIADTLNQNGLSSNYVSGVTDFDAYLASNPMHTATFSGYEWFGNFQTTTASVVYDLASVVNINRLALWNEESSGIGRLDLYSSTDGTNFTPLALGLVPPDNPLADYPATVFSFGSTAAQYVRFDMSGCPQAVPGSYPSCAIGEVAFAVGDGPATVPEPSSWLLLATAMGGVGIAVRRRRAQKTSL